MFLLRQVAYLPSFLFSLANRASLFSTGTGHKYIQITPIPLFSVTCLHMDPDPATVKFQQALPYALLRVSPSLSALHTSRVRKLAGTVTPQQLDSCARCGTFFHVSDSSTRITRLNRPTRTCLQSKCGQCGWLNEFAVTCGNASLFPRRKRGSSITYEKQKTISSAAPPAPEPKPIDQPVPVAATSAGLVSKAKSRAKKRTGLQEMLARNREKEQRAKVAPAEPQSGLAAFLDSL